MAVASWYDLNTEKPEPKIPSHELAMRRMIATNAAISFAEYFGCEALPV